MAELLHWLTLYAPVVFAIQMWFGPGWCCPPLCPEEIPEVECTRCIDDIGPEYLLVSIPDGWGNDTCTECDGVAGDWVVPFSGYIGGSGLECDYRRNILPDIGPRYVRISNLCRDVQGGTSTTRDCLIIVQFSISSISPLNYRANCLVSWGARFFPSDDNQREGNNFRKDYGSDRIPCMEEIELPFFDRTRLTTGAGTGFACDEHDVIVTIAPTPEPL